METDITAHTTDVEEASRETVELSPAYGVALSSLRYGFLVAAALFIAGLIWSAFAREELSEQVTPIEKVPGRLADGTPMAAINLAILALMFTPVITVLCVGVEFWRLGDRRYGALSFGVLAILGASIALALAR